MFEKIHGKLLCILKLLQFQNLPNKSNKKIKIKKEIKIYYNRKSIRLKNYDYSKNGMYFVTICTKNREKILSKIVGVDAHIDPKTKQCQKNIHNNEFKNVNIELQYVGKIVQKYIKNINITYKNVCVNSYIIMPDHLHMIICINDLGSMCVEDSGSMWASTPTKKITISKIIRSIKTLVTKEIGYSIWQRNYYEHIIRNENEYFQICEYIKNNPTRYIIG